MKYLHLLLASIGIVVAGISQAAGLVSVVDGDTIDVGNVRYRLFGIDAPESAQRCNASSGKQWACGTAAITEMQRLVGGKNVVCEDRGDGDYDRRLGLCRADGMDISAAMVDAGMAWSFKKYSHAYDENEDAARAKHIGIWQAETQTAWDYRAARWNVESQVEATGKCPIKGNINRKHEKVYHVPWDRDYKRTKIDAGKGERWFCDEADAIKAGWRAPKRGKE